MCLSRKSHLYLSKLCFWISLHNFRSIVIFYSIFLGYEPCICIGDSPEQLVLEVYVCSHHARYKNAVCKFLLSTLGWSLENREWLFFLV